MLNERLKNLRLAKGLTLQQVGDAFGISKASVSSWESGRSNPDHKKLETLAELFGTSVQFLIAGNVNHNTANPKATKVPFIEWSSILHKHAVLENASLVSVLHSSPSGQAFATRYPASQTIQWQLGAIPPGSILIVDPSIAPGPNDTVIAQTDHEIVLARFSSTPENKSILVKTDTSEFQQITVGQSKLIGVVLEWQISAKLR